MRWGDTWRPLQPWVMQQKPQYQHFRDILLQGLKALGAKDDGKLDFSSAQNGDVSVKSRKRKVPLASDDDEVEEKHVKKKSPRGRPPKAATTSPKPPPKGRGRGRGKKQ
ncbi:unnamed protein product [Ranitomeya imitator]|uniref:Uncharacterized protein n=1 Tax=Ranitomeya imitator TaxID=111125 RepID=A0ABN9LMK9_9NEOB|nr:unnamed protein product [Ranitomeya imitator]